ncbi:MAG: Hint domain-containing protein [Pseudomonadota bacterium]|nr:Hint domain-containing protein [Pseudomonadota bacterium]
MFKSIGAARFRRADTAPDVAHVALSHPVAAPVPESVPARARPLSEVAEHPAAPAPLCGTAIDLSQDDALLSAVMAQSAAPAPAQAKSDRTAPVSWTLPGFDGKCRIATIFGDLPIEALRRRDKVKTITGAYREIVWIDKIRLDADFMARHHSAHPVHIRAKAIGGTQPSRTMLVSPGQMIWSPNVSGQFSAVPAARLVGLPGVQTLPRGDITYYRFHTGCDEKISIDGAWFCVGPDRA